MDDLIDALEKQNNPRAYRKKQLKRIALALASILVSIGMLFGFIVAIVAVIKFAIKLF